MSSYARKTSLETSEDRQPISRRGQRQQLNDPDFNLNGNNNTDNIEKSKSSLSSSESGRRFSGSKSPGRNRKSKLIEAMAANFEKKNSDGPAVRSSASRRGVPNGDAKITPLIVEPDACANDDGDDSKAMAEEKKVSPSARRGKSQRSKRMLRQKRRSTGVVNKEDLEDIESTDTTRDEVNLRKETDDNTQTNELSPAAAYDRLPVDDDGQASLDRTDTANGPSDPILDTPRRNPGVEDCGADLITSSSAESDELRLKLEAAESTITRLRQEIKIMDKELHVLEDENDQLRKDNKMLEDENRTMLRIMKNGQ